MGYTFVLCYLGITVDYHQNNIGLWVEGSGYGDPLLLTATEGYTPFADYRPLLVRQNVDVRTQGACVDHPFEPRLVVLVAEDDVFQNGSVQQPRSLWHVRHSRFSFEVHLAEQTIHLAEQSEQHRRFAASHFTGYYRQFTCARQICTNCHIGTYYTV